MAVDGAQEARAHATGAETWGTAADGAQEARAHAMGAETRGTATDGAREARAYVMGAETRGMAADGARDGAETRGAQRGGALSRIITASILHFKEHTTYCLRLSTATGA